MAAPKGSDSLLTLQASISSTFTLIRSFQLTLQSPAPPHSKTESSPQPLALLSDSCKILRAQTTKLSLLILNKPFTPPAIIYILNACAGGCLPAMMSALELCPPDIYSYFLHTHIKTSVSRIMAELLHLISSIPQDERGIEPQSRDILASTGVLWAECDEMVTLAINGIVSLAAQNVEEYHGLLKDAIEELEQWNPAEEEDVSDTDSVSSYQQTTNAISSGDSADPSALLEALSVTDITRLRNRSLSTLRTVRLLYPALKKRRISSFPNITSTTSLEHLPQLNDIDSLNFMIMSTKNLTEAADEIAGALYDGDEVQVTEKLNGMVRGAKQCAVRATKNWTGEEDEFTGWVGKWLARLTEISVERGTRVSK